MTETGNGQADRPPHGRSRSRGRVVAIVASVLSGLIVLSAAGWLLYYRATFHTFAWWVVPPSVSYCGRRYDQGRTISALPPAYTYSQVLIVEPSGWPVYAMRPAASSAQQVPGMPCTMGLALKRGTDQYVLYGLVGGP